MVEGVGYTPGAPHGDDPGAGIWWGENLIGTRVAPVHLQNAPNKLVYTPHVYGPSVYLQKYFQDPFFPNNMPAVWQAHFAFAKELTGTPIVIGEMGGSYIDLDKVWQDWAIPYAASQGFGVFYFALNPDSKDTTGLVAKGWSLPQPGSVEASKLEALSQLPSTDVFTICPECMLPELKSNTATAEQETAPSVANPIAGVTPPQSTALPSSLPEVELQSDRQHTELGQAGTSITHPPSAPSMQQQEENVQQQQQQEEEEEQEQQEQEQEQEQWQTPTPQLASLHLQPSASRQGSSWTDQITFVNVWICSALLCIVVLLVRERHTRDTQHMRVPTKVEEGSDLQADDSKDRLSSNENVGDDCVLERAMNLTSGRVRVHGLRNEPHLNGIEGSIMGQASTPNGVRWNVLCDGGEALCVQACNLELLAVPMGRACD